MDIIKSLDESFQDIDEALLSRKPRKDKKAENSNTMAKRCQHCNNVMAYYSHTCPSCGKKIKEDKIMDLFQKIDEAMTPPPPRKKKKSTHPLKKPTYPGSDQDRKKQAERQRADKQRTRERSGRNRSPFGDV